MKNSLLRMPPACGADRTETRVRCLEVDRGGLLGKRAKWPPQHRFL